jgi:hypothetical protein
MPNYAIRVELKGDPPAERYESLHALMAQKGFHQIIAGVDTQGNKRNFALPHAMYYGASVNDCPSVRDSLSAAIKAQIQKDIIVFVVQAETWAIG